MLDDGQLLLIDGSLLLIENSNPEFEQVLISVDVMVLLKLQMFGDKIYLPLNLLRRGN